MKMKNACMLLISIIAIIAVTLTGCSNQETQNQNITERIANISDEEFTFSDALTEDIDAMYKEIDGVSTQSIISANNFMENLGAYAANALYHISFFDSSGQVVSEENYYYADDNSEYVEKQDGAVYYQSSDHSTYELDEQGTLRYIIDLEYGDRIFQSRYDGYFQLENEMCPLIDSVKTSGTETVVNAHEMFSDLSNMMLTHRGVGAVSDITYVFSIDKDTQMINTIEYKGKFTDGKSGTFAKVDVSYDTALPDVFKDIKTQYEKLDISSRYDLTFSIYNDVFFNEVMLILLEELGEPNHYLTRIEENDTQVWQIQETIPTALAYRYVLQDNYQGFLDAEYTQKDETHIHSAETSMIYLKRVPSEIY